MHKGRVARQLKRMSEHLMNGKLILGGNTIDVAGKEKLRIELQRNYSKANLDLCH